MAPETIIGRDTGADPPVDVFAFGILAWMVVTGGEPYTKLADEAIKRGVARGTLRPPLPTDESDFFVTGRVGGEGGDGGMGEGKNEGKNEGMGEGGEGETGEGRDDGKNEGTGGGADELADGEPHSSHTTRRRRGSSIHVRGVLALLQVREKKRRR
jgi:hypothetical protein